MTTRAALAGRIPVTRLTPALPDDRWRPKAFEGEVVPFRATVFREGHDQVGAMLVLTSPSGTRRRERMSPLAAGTDRWEAGVLLDERGVWHWHVTGFDDEVATWRHDAALKVDAAVDVELMFEIGARLLDRAVAEKSRPLAARRRLKGLAAALRDDAASVATAGPHRRPRPRGVRPATARGYHDRLPRARSSSSGAAPVWAPGTSSSPAPRVHGS